MFPVRNLLVALGAGLLFLVTSCGLPAEEGLTASNPVESFGADFKGLSPERLGPPVQCEQPLYPFASGFAVHQVPRSPEPDPREPFQDPVFGTCVVRVTDRHADLASEDPSAGIKNEYARVQAFNADGSYLLARSIEAFWYLYDADTLQPLGELPIEDEPRWSPTNPHQIFYISGSRLMSLDLQTGAIRVHRDFADDLPFEPAMVWTRYEGSPSTDGRLWGLMAEDQDWLAGAFLVYDVEADQVVAARTLEDWSEDAREIDSVTISPSGRYFLAYLDLFCEPGELGSDEHPCGLMVYDRDLRNGRGLLRVVGHSDLALDSQGRDVLIYQDIDTDHIAMMELNSGQITPLWPIDFSHSPLGFHFSGKAYSTPGWVLVSTYSGGHPVSFTWMDDQVFAVELRPNGRLLRLAHTHSVVDQEVDHDYWAEPHATVNRDFTRILFTSNWGRSGTGAVDMYMVILPPDWLERLP
jgi:hypothetical protein